MYMWNDPNVFRSENYVVLDFEVEVLDGRYGNALDKRNKLFCACWYNNRTKQYHYVEADEYSQGRLLEDIADADFIVAHNAKYELGWLARCGYDIFDLRTFDTKMAEYVLLGNLVAGDPKRGLARTNISLDACCARYGFKRKDPIVDLWMKHGICVSQMPRKWVRDRCVQDVDTTHSLFRMQRKQLVDRKQLAVLSTRTLLTPTLVDMEATGMCMDVERVTKTTAEYRAWLTSLEQEMATMTGGINWRSPKQVGVYIYDTLGFQELTTARGTPIRSGTGGRKTDQKTLAKLTATTASQRAYLELRKKLGHVGAALSKNLETFQRVADSGTNILQAEFNQMNTATHRLSSSGIDTTGGGSTQFQNIPRQFKSLFTARKPGWLIAEVDGAQIEFRVAAFLGNDEAAKADISNPEFDIHCLSASVRVGKTYEEVRKAYLAGEAWAKAARQAAKEDTFKPLYGGTKGTTEQELWYSTFATRYPALRSVQEGWVKEVLTTKRLRTPWGLEFTFPHISVSRTGHVNVGSSVYNYPVQALATAEIIPIAIAAFARNIRRDKLEDYIVPVCTVHDSLICEVHPDHVDDYKRLAIESFGVSVSKYLCLVYGLVFDVPLGIGIKIGTHWGEGKEEKYEYVDTRRS